jgi:hypothetical protein
VTKDEQRAYNNTYYASHKEEIKARARAYNASHKEEAKKRPSNQKEVVAARNRAYYAAHAEEMRSRQAKRRITHKQEIQNYHKAYCASPKYKKYHKKYCVLNETKIKEYRMSHRRTTAERFLIKKYGITMDEYDMMIVAQDGKCAICGEHQSNLRRILNVDHNHITGEIRGLICGSCNRAIGLFKENTANLLNAIKYLNEWSNNGI